MSLSRTVFRGVLLERRRIRSLMGILKFIFSKMSRQAQLNNLEAYKQKRDRILRVLLLDINDFDTELSCVI